MNLYVVDILSRIPHSSLVRILLVLEYCYSITNLRIPV